MKSITIVRGKHFRIDDSSTEATVDDIKNISNQTIRPLFTLSGEGTEGNPYVISNDEEWNSFANYVNGGDNFSGKFVKLTSDISVSQFAGTDDANSFQGTFDGDAHTLTFNKGTAESPFSEQYCAPFRHVKNATIKNLHVAGTIYTNAMKAAGFVGESHGALTLAGCISSIAINSIKNGDGTHGGFVATLSGASNTITIDGCVFDGSFATTNGTVGCGGFIGWGVYNKPTIKNSLMMPGSVSEGMLGSTFARWYTGDDGAYEPTITNCYYVTADNLPTDQGTEAYALATAPGNIGEATADYGMVKACANGILFDGKYYVAPAAVTLADDSDNNAEAISNANGYVADITLQGRTLYKDGMWNTLCLPFSVTLSGSPLDGATARALTSASIDGSTLNLTFGDAVTELQAGVPYIIKWDAAADYVDDNVHNIVSPVFSGVTIDKTTHDYDNEASSDDDRVRFLGTYNAKSFTAEDKTILLMGGSNTLYYPTAGASLGACRAYFKIGDGDALARRLTSFSISFSDGEATGIVSISKESGSRGASEGWYTLDGRRLQAQPSQRGIYINNGKKVVIK